MPVTLLLDKSCNPMKETLSKIVTFARYYWISIVLATVISYLSLAPGDEFARIPSFPYEDKVVHFLMYFGLAFVLLGNSIIRLGITSMQHRKRWLWIIGIPVLWGGCMELLQQFCTTSRSGDWLDELTNTLGATTGFFVGKWVLPKILKRALK
jgi:VanZ family protein